MTEEKIISEMHNLENLIQVKFNDIKYLADAMNATKCNDANRSKNNDEHKNHAIATVGDAVLKTINADFLFRQGKNRGDITTIKSIFEKNKTLYNIANSFEIINFAYNDKYFYKDDPPKEYKVSNSKHNQYIEAIIGAIFYDKGFECAKNWVINWLYPKINESENSIKETLENLVKLHDGKNYFISNQIRELSKESNEKIIEKIKKIEYVFVADNPSQNEVSDKDNIIYLNPNGQAGQNFDRFIKWLGIDKDKCIILNKTLKHTKLTSDLRDNLDWTSQKEVAELINKLMKENPTAKICLLGFTDFFNISSKSLFKEFYNNLNSSNMLRAYYHPSRRQIFTLAEQEQIEKNIPDKKIEFFDYVGKKQYEDRKKEYKKFLEEFIYYFK